MGCRSAVLAAWLVGFAIFVPQAVSGAGSNSPGTAGRPGPSPDIGTLLIASRDLADANFAKTAVIVLNYGSEGAVGLIINRPSSLDLATLLPNVAGISDWDAPVFVGGPVRRERIMLLIAAADAPQGAVTILPGVFATGDLSALEALAAAGLGDRRLKAYIGYAGWGPGQLDAEIGRGDWFLARADAKVVFEWAPSDIWSELIKRHEGRWVEMPTGHSRAAVEVAKR